LSACWAAGASGVKHFIASRGAAARRFAAKRLNIGANATLEAPQVVLLTRHYEDD
jgi:hypothetical protein